VKNPWGRAMGKRGSSRGRKEGGKEDKEKAGKGKRAELGESVMTR